MPNLQIAHVNTLQEAEILNGMGYVPIECSFGNQGSAIDGLCMDHHGKYSHLEGVAVRAYREHFGALRLDFLDGSAKFVVTGAADADACFAIAALIGELPHPSREQEFAKAPEPVRRVKTRDLMTLANLVNRVDTAPVGVFLDCETEGPTLLLWNQLSSSTQDAMAFHAGVDRWRTLTSRPLKALLAATQAEEHARITTARQAIVTSISYDVALVQSEAWGFDVWYADHAPCIVALTPYGNVTIGCTDEIVAAGLFGVGGLKNVFDALQPAGWGGRETIGGSPRGVLLSEDQALEAARVVAHLVKK